MKSAQGRSWSAIQALVVTAVLSSATPAGAALTEQRATPIRKLSRGVANSAAGVLEIPLTISSVGRMEGPVAALSWGLLVGLGAAVTRTLAGLVEVVTFPFALPCVGYGPMVQPEFLLQPEQSLGAPTTP